MRPGFIAAIAATLVALAPGAPANAQAPAEDADELRDYDEERENRSEFWERALSPAAGTYEDLVAQAQGIINSRNLAGASEARTLLSDAIAARPNAPLAHFWLGLLERRAKNYKACAASLGRALTVDPDFTSPIDGPGLTRHWYADYELGLCSALSGELGDAAARFRHITSQHTSCGEKRTPDCHSWQVSWRLGESLMALGRLEEAIEQLRASVNNRGGGLSARYTLAVALERDEQRAEATPLLDAAASGDYKQRSLWAAGKDYIPAEDEFYYRGLVAAHRGQDFLARIMFRAYLNAAPTSPWKSRALSHGSRVQKTLVGSGALIRGGARLDITEGTRAIRAADARFRACVASFPSQLFQVKIKQRLTAAATRPKRAAVARTVTVNHLDPLNVQHESTRIIEVTRCLRQVGESIAMPGVTGAAGADASIEFNVAR